MLAVVRPNNFANLQPGDITWHEDRWDNPESRFLAFTLHDRDGSAGGDLLAAFNAHDFEVQLPLPATPGSRWYGSFMNSV
jgi:isoamylase